MAPLLVLLVLLFGAAVEGTLPGLPGGLFPVPVEDPGVVNANRGAEKSFNSRGSDPFYAAVYNVMSAQMQVVEGLMYHLTLEMRNTVCRRDEPDLQNCPFHQDLEQAKPMTCTFKVWYRPWLGPMEVHEAQCSGVLK